MDFSRIHNNALDHFTSDQLMKILNSLGQHIDVEFSMKPCSCKPAWLASKMLSIFPGHLKSTLSTAQWPSFINPKPCITWWF